MTKPMKDYVQYRIKDSEFIIVAYPNNDGLFSTTSFDSPNEVKFKRGFHLHSVETRFVKRNNWAGVMSVIKLQK